MSLAISTAQYLAKLGISTSPGTYGLDGSGTPVGNNTLSWRWPAGLVAGITAGTVVYNQLTLQRSLSASNRPNAAVVYDVASRTSPVVEAAWSNLNTWNRSQFLADPVANAGGGWPDTSPVPTAYRLILNFAKAGDPVLPPYGEMTWNVRMMIPQQSFCFQDPNNAGQCVPVNGNIPAGQRTLIWTAPVTSWWP